MMHMCEMCLELGNTVHYILYRFIILVETLADIELD